MVQQFQQEFRSEEKKPPPSPSCAQGHEWRPTIIIGYYQCAHCNALAACTACVSKVRGRATITGTCQAHLQLIPAQMQHQEEHRRCLDDQ